MHKPLSFTMHVRKPTTFELTAHESIRLDRLTTTPSGARDAQRHGPLLRPGSHRFALEPGSYVLRTMSNADLRVVRGGDVGFEVVGGKDIPPPPSPSPAGRGDDSFATATAIIAVTYEDAESDKP
jgi:hypothetical protein